VNLSCILDFSDLISVMDTAPFDTITEHDLPNDNHTGHDIRIDQVNVVEETERAQNDENDLDLSSQVENIPENILTTDDVINNEHDDDELQDVYHSFEFPSREDVNKYDNDGYTPLQRAVQTRFSKETIETLLHLGADMTLFTKSKARPIFNPNGFINLQFQRFAGDHPGQQQHEQQIPPQNNNNGGVLSHEPFYETSIFHLLIDSQYFNIKLFKFLLSKIPQKGQKDNVTGKILKKEYKIDTFTEKHTLMSVLMKLLSQPDQQCDTIRALFHTFDNNGTVAQTHSSMTVPKRDTFNKKKIDINSTDSDGNTALHLAILYKHSVDVIDFLINNGADIDIRNAHNTGQTPFFMSLGSKQWSSARLLLKSGCDLNQCDKFGRCPLHVAIKTHDSPDDFIIEMLDHPSIDANYLTIARRNALMEATEFSRSPIVLKKLIYTMEKQNDSNFLTKYFKIYQSYETFEQNYALIFPHIDNNIDQHATPPPPNHKQPAHNNLMVNATDSGGMSAIHFSCSGYHINENTLRVLLATPGINANKTTFSNWNALTFALRGGHVDINIIKLLLDHGCDPNTIDSDLHDPFVVAIQYDCRKTVIAMLLKKTNIFKLYDKKGYTVLMFVVLKGILRPRVDITNHDTDDVFEMLIEHVIDCIVDGIDGIDAVKFAQDNVKDNAVDDF